jgi:cell division protein FtsB
MMAPEDNMRCCGDMQPRPAAPVGCSPSPYIATRFVAILPLCGGPSHSGGMNVVRMFIVIVLGLASVAGVMDTLWAPQGWPRRLQLKRDYAALRQRNDVLEAKVADLRRQIVSLGTRHEVQEQWVRQTLGYVREQDVVVHLKP